MIKDSSLDTIATISDFKSPLARKVLDYFGVELKEIAPLCHQFETHPINAQGEQYEEYSVENGLRTTMKTMAAYGAIHFEMAIHDFQIPYRVGDMNIPSEKLSPGLTSDTVLYQTAEWLHPVPRETAIATGEHYASIAQQILPGLFLDDLLLAPAGSATKSTQQK